MKKIYIDCDEWYPVYSFLEEPMLGSSTLIEVDDLKYLRWKAAFDNFNKVQDEIEKELKKIGIDV